MIARVNDCPICLRPVAGDAVTCPHCGNSVDVFRTGYFARPDLSRPKTAFIWVAALVILVLVAAGIFRGCSTPDAAPSAPASSR